MAAASFSVTRRFFDDKNYPRGFSRHGDYTIKESQVLEQYGQAFHALDLALREPVNALRKPSSKKPGINTVPVLTPLNGFIPYPAM